MSGKVAAHVRGNVVSYLALFVALSGTAWALGSNTVKSRHIVNGQVKSQDLGSNAVTYAKVADNAIGSAEVIGNSLTGADIEEGSLGEVPSATSADTATTATSANNAGLLDSFDSTDFSRPDSERADLDAPQPSGTAELDGFITIPAMGRLNISCGGSSMNPPTARVEFESTSAAGIDVYLSYTAAAFSSTQKWTILPTGTQETLTTSIDPAVGDLILSDTASERVARLGVAIDTVSETCDFAAYSEVHG